MKKHWILILLILSFWGCNKTQTKEEPILELIAYDWSSYDELKKSANGEWGDTTILYVKNKLYAQIFDNGDCQVSKYKGPHDVDLYSIFKIDTALLNPVLKIFETINSDTIMIEKTEPGSYLYDGPLLRLIGKGKNNENVSLKFNNTRYSNSKLVNFYRYINLKSDSVGSNENLFQSRESRMKEIYILEFDSLPKFEIKKTIQFSIPETK